MAEKCPRCGRFMWERESQIPETSDSDVWMECINPKCRAAEDRAIEASLAGLGPESPDSEGGE